MRIITGSARGAKLLTLEGEATRPTAERTKEAVFSIIQFDIEGRNVLDLYAGSGQLALEALSRGAAKAVLCDKSKQAIDIIRKNAERTRLIDRCSIHNCDASQIIRKLGGEKFDLVFIDPPYALKAVPSALNDLLNNNSLKATSLIVCETADHSDVFCGDERLAERFNIKKSAKYGVAHVTILQLKEENI